MGTLLWIDTRGNLEMKVVKGLTVYIMDAPLGIMRILGTYRYPKITSNYANKHHLPNLNGPSQNPGQ